MISILFLIIGFILLINCSDILVDGCSNLAKCFGISSLVIGLTIVAFGTSAPEATVSIIASLNNNNDISIGNVVGSNICNLLLVLGISCMFGNIITNKKIVTRDYLFSLFSYLLLFILTCIPFLIGIKTGVIKRSSGIILLFFILVYLKLLFNDSRNNKKEKNKEKFKFKYIFYIILGLLGIIVGGNAVVDGAICIAKMLGVSDNLIALTIVAIGTSLPELFTSISASRKGESDISIGNVIGSNIFNILFILGIASIVSPIKFGYESFIDIIIMNLIGIIIYLLILYRKCVLTKKDGFIMLFIYLLYTIYIIIR